MKLGWPVWLGWWMIAGSVLSAFVIVFVIGAYLGHGLDLHLAVWLGMAGPLLATLCSMVATDRAYRNRPSSVTGVMITAFVAKMVFFGGYIALVITSGWVRPVPFALSFIGYLLVFYIVEAFRLRRLFAGV